MGNQDFKILSKTNNFFKRIYEGTLCNEQNKNHIEVLPHKLFTLDLNKAKYI